MHKRAGLFTTSSFFNTCPPSRALQSYLSHRRKRQCRRQISAYENGLRDEAQISPDSHHLQQPSTQSPGLAGPEHAARMQALYDRETPFLDKLLKEVDSLGFVDRELEKLSGQRTTSEEKREAVIEVVDKHYAEMSEGLLMVTAGYAQAAYGSGHADLGETLEMLREEILQRTSAQLPPELRILDTLTLLTKEPRDKRLARLREVHTSGFEEIPATPLSSLRTSTTQMLEDIEDKLDIIDRTLLARLCLVREDIDDAAVQLDLVQPGSEYWELMQTTWRLLPEGNAGFIKNLMQTGNADQRKARLEQCIRDDFQGNQKDQVAKLWRAQGVRPGRLLNTIAALQNGLKLGPGLRSAPGKDTERLQTIHQEIVSILNELIDPSPM